MGTKKDRRFPVQRSRADLRRVPLDLAEENPFPEFVHRDQVDFVLPFPVPPASHPRPFTRFGEFLRKVRFQRLSAEHREALEAKVAVCYAEKILATRDRDDWQTILEDEEDTFLSVNNYRGKPDRVIRALEESSELKDVELTREDLTKAVQYSKKREKETV